MVLFVHATPGEILRREIQGVVDKGQSVVQGTVFQGSFVQGDFCPRRLLSKETIVQGDNSPVESQY